MRSSADRGEVGCGVRLRQFFGGFDGVGDEGGDGHRADSTGDGRVGGAAVNDGGKLDVADAAGVKAGVDDDGAVADPVAADEFGLADGADDDLGAADDFGEIFGAGVADGDGGVGGEQHHGHGAAEDGAAADDDGFAAFDGNLITAEEAHDAGGRGGAVGGLVHGHAAESVGGDSVDVFLEGDAVEAGALVDLFGDGVLEEDAADAGVGVEVVDGGEEFGGGRGGGKRDAEGFHADAAAGVALHFDVGGGGGIVADEEGGEDGRFLQIEAGDAGGEFGFEFFGVSFAVENHGHGDRVQGTGCRVPVRG